MSHPLVTCPTGSTLDQAARLMWEFDCGIVPVVGDDGRLEGVVTDRDICMAAYTQGLPLHAIPVTTAMARQVVAVHGQDAIASAEALMREHQVRRLPVLDAEQRPIGLLSLNDLTRAAARSHRSGAEHDVVSTLSAICQPRRGSAAAEPRPLAAVAG
jgi:CBS domain-containing protein